MEYAYGFGIGEVFLLIFGYDMLVRGPLEEVKDDILIGGDTCFDKFGGYLCIADTLDI